MNEVIKIFGLAFIAAFVCQILKKKWPGLAHVLNITTAVVIIMGSLSGIIRVIEFSKGLALSANINSRYIKSILQILGISLLVKLILSILKDMGEETLSFGVEVGGRICVLLLALPFVVDAINALVGLLGA